MRSYAIGDIHGHLDQLRSLHRLIEADMRLHGPAPIVHIGDLVDRGPDSAGVVDYLAKGIAAGADWVVLKGNHDRMFATFLDDQAGRDPGLRGDLSYLHPSIGGSRTLASYGIANPGDRPLAPVHSEAGLAVPKSHRDFLASCPLFLRRGEVMFVHAGIRPGIPLDAQADDDLVWIRKPFLDDPCDHGALIVHGHTAIDRPRHYGNRVNIDASAGYGGPLSAVVIEGRAVWDLTNGARIPVLPGQ